MARHMNAKKDGGRPLVPNPASGVSASTATIGGVDVGVISTVAEGEGEGETVWQRDGTHNLIRYLHWCGSSMLSIVGTAQMKGYVKAR
jgi:hypothetical protein